MACRTALERYSDVTEWECMGCSDCATPTGAVLLDESPTSLPPQAMALGAFPTVRVVHTGGTTPGAHGQVMRRGNGDR